MVYGVMWGVGGDGDVESPQWRDGGYIYCRFCGWTLDMTAVWYME